MHTHCPKCGHTPLPANQALPAACPGCGVILAKIGAGAPVRQRAVTQTARQEADDGGWLSLLGHVPDRVDRTAFWARVALLLAFAIWGCVLIAMDYRDGEIGKSFLHRPLLVFHEAGHVIFSFFGEWIRIAGGTFGQLLMPLILAFALLRTNRDPYGAALGIWFFGVSLLDVAPYMYDALDPKLMLLSGKTGAESDGHDFINLFSSMGLLHKARLIAAITHKAGAVVVILSLLWSGWLLLAQKANLSDSVLHES